MARLAASPSAARHGNRKPSSPPSRTRKARTSTRRGPSAPEQREFLPGLAACNASVEKTRKPPVKSAINASAVRFTR